MYPFKAAEDTISTRRTSKAHVALQYVCINSSIEMVPSSIPLTLALTALRKAKGLAAVDGAGSGISGSEPVRPKMSNDLYREDCWVGVIHIHRPLVNTKHHSLWLAE